MWHNIISTQSRCLYARRFCLVAIVLIGSIALWSSQATAADIVSFPVLDASGFFDYDGTNLTLDNTTTVSKIIYGFQSVPYPPYVLPISSPGTVSDPLVTNGAVAQFGGLTYSGSGLGFSDGTFSLAIGADVVFSADVVDVVLVPTSQHTANINPSPYSINLQNVAVSQPSVGTSRFVTDWLAATGGSGRGVLAVTLTNTDSGSLDPLMDPASGNALLTLQPATPEPASVLLLLVAGGWFVRARHGVCRAG